MILYFLNPFLYIALFIGYLLVKRNNSGSKVFPRHLVLSCFVLCLFSTPFLISPLVENLEDGYPPLSIGGLDTTIAYHIMILGAGHGYDHRLPPNSKLSHTALMRLIEGIRIHRQLPHSLLITSSGSVYGLESQASVMRDAAILLGITPSDIRMLEEPHNTETEAASYVANFGTDTPVIICTSSYHMRRAIGLFENYGLKQAIAAPTDFYIKRDQPAHWGQFLPNLSYFNMWQTVLKEYIGIFINGSKR